MWIFVQIDGILAAVDCTKEQQLAKRFDISGFPTGILVCFKSILCAVSQQILEFNKSSEFSPKNMNYNTEYFIHCLICVLMHGIGDLIFVYTF